VEKSYLELARLLRSYALRRYGQLPLAFTLHFGGQADGHREPLPVVPLEEDGTVPSDMPAGRQSEWAPTPAPAPALGPSTWAAGPVPKHLADFSHVYWPGVGRFALSRAQARVVARLWRAYESGDWEVTAAELQKAAETESNVYQLFRTSPAYGKLVLSLGRGLFRLPDLPLQEDD